MKIFNLKNYLNQIINILDIMNLTITNIDKKIDYIENQNEVSLEEIDMSKLNFKESLVDENEKLIDKLNKITLEKTLLTEENNILKEQIDALISEKNGLLEQMKNNSDSKISISKKELEKMELIKKEFAQLKKVKNAIYANEKGRVFWDNIDKTVNLIKEDKKDNLSSVAKGLNGSYGLTIAGITKTRSEWKDEWNISKEGLRYRVKHNWDNLEILFGKNFKYIDAKRFYKKYPNAIVYDTLDESIKEKLKETIDVNI